MGAIVNIPHCTECGAPLVKSPGGYATCPHMHERLKQVDVWRSAWVDRLIKASIDVRQIPSAQYEEIVGPRGGKKRVIKIRGGRFVARHSACLPETEWSPTLKAGSFS